MTDGAAHPIRYARLGYACLQVTRLEVSTAFYIHKVGLQRTASPSGQTWLRCSDKPYDLILVEGDTAGLAAVGFELESLDELTRAFEHVSSLGFKPQYREPDSCNTMKVAAGFTFTNPQTGLTLDFYAGQAICSEPFEPTVANIARLGHVVLNCESYADAHRFWVEQLGFVISDHVPGRIAFLRAWPNALHHSFALLEGPANGLNHVNFMVTDIDDIGQAMNRMKKADVPIVFGPGRHLPSTSIFLYFLDPDGMTAEYSFGMEEISEEDGREPRELEPKPEVLDTWGSLPDPRFGKQGKILSSHV